MSKLAVFFPGLGYTTEKPLLYFGLDIVREHGYKECRKISYTIVKKEGIRGNADKIKEVEQELFLQTEKQLADVDWENYDEVLFVSKSIGTAVAAEYAQKYELLNIKHILYTPLTITYDHNPVNALAFIGTKDGWSDVHKIEELSRKHNIKLEIYKDCNHSLETDNVFENINILHDVMIKTKNFLDKSPKKIAYYHLPGLFEFYDLYRIFLPLFREHREYFYDWCEIGSIYGAPADCIWGGGRVGFGDYEPQEVLALMQEYGISARLTFSNSLLEKEHLSDKKCNELCRLFEKKGNGIIVYSDLLLDYLKENYPEYYYVSSTTKVLTTFDKLLEEVKRDDFLYIVPDFRLNKAFDKLNTLSEKQKDKLEFLCNECCWFGCHDRERCYETVSRENLGENCPEYICAAPDAGNGYQFSKAMSNPGFIGIEHIKNTYLPMGFSNFKIEGRGLGSAMILEFLLYYMTKPEYQIHVREAIYLDNMLDLF